MSSSNQSFHENLQRSSPQKMGSDRSFGFIFSFLFLILSLFPLAKGSGARFNLLYLSIALAIIASFIPWLLKPLNWVWLRLGLILQKVVSPVIMAFLYFFVFTPIGLILRAFKKDILNLDFSDQSQDSYWIKAGANPTDMKDQF